jgi:hypothetical protein
MMRSLIIVLAMLFWSVSSATAQVSVSIGINVPSYPQLVRVPGYPVYYAPGLNANFFFYDGQYWVYERDNWYASSWYNGPWGLVSPMSVPLFVLRIPVRYYRAPPAYFYGWRPDGPPRWGHHWGHEWEQQRSGWDRWDRRTVLIPAPLPVYQRHYSGNRYPQGMQQEQIHRKNYRYQPRDPNVRQHESAYILERDPGSRGRGQPDAPQKRSQRQLDDQRAFQPSPPQGTTFGRDYQQPQRSKEDARRSEPSTTPPRHREWNGQAPGPASQPLYRQERHEQPQSRRNQDPVQQGRGPSHDSGREQGKGQDRGQANGQERNR